MSLIIVKIFGWDMPLKLSGILCVPLIPLIWGASEGQKVVPLIYPII